MAAALGRRHVVSIFLFLAVSALTWGGMLSSIDDALMDWRFGVFKRAPTQSLVVVEIDPDSLVELQSWPWSRSVYANVVRELHAAGARTVGIDVDFSSLSDTAGDNAFRDALGERPGEVVLPVFLQPQSAGRPSDALRATAPHPFFLDHAAVASVNLIAEPSGIARRGWFGSDTEGGYLSSFAASLAGFPPTRTGSFYIDFSIDPAQLSRLSIADVAAGRFDPRIVSGCNVLIGATAVELGDEYSTSVYGLLPGVILHGLSYESLVQGRALFRVDAIFVLPLAALVLILLRRPRDNWTSARFVAVHAAVCLATVGVPAALQIFSPVSADVAPMLVVQVACVGLTTLRELERRARDILRHQREVARHQALIALVVRDSSDGIIITDEFGRIVVFNDRAASLLGVEQRNCTGQNLTALIADFPASGSPVKTQSGRDPTESLPVVSEYVVARGDIVRTLEIVEDWTTYKGQLDHAADGVEERKVFAYSLRDITARKRIERSEREAKQAAIAANQAKSQLIAAMSHELRTPLNAIIGFSQLLRDEILGPLGNQSYKSHASDILNCGNHLLSVVNDILQVVKIEAGDVEIRVDEFELAAIVRDCAASFSDDVTRARKTLRIAVPEQLKLNCDERLVRRALLQLLSNAVKFTREGDVIDVTASASEADGVQIEIRDTGVGVDPQYLSRLTDQFYQADGSLNRSHDGMGLGLYLVRKYVEMLAGDLTLESEKGVFFKARIDLPATCLLRYRDAA
jgi:PAS domain S-box-containing protein